MTTHAKAFASRLNTREKILALLVLWVVLLIWLDFSWRGFKDIQSKWEASSSAIAMQDNVLAEKDKVAAQAQLAREQLDPARTFNANGLSVLVQRLAEQAGFPRNYTTTTARTRQHGNMLLHTITLKVNNASMEQLIRFDSLFNQKAPYITLNEITIQPSRSDPFLNNVDYDITAFEFSETLL